MGLLGPPVVGGTLLLVAIVAFATTTEGAIAVTDVDGFLEFYVGVFALLCLTASVVWGLIANNRFFLRIGHRIFAQAVHRGFSVASVGFLLIHIFVKVADGHAAITDAAVPFLSHSGPYARPGIFVGLGTIAGDLMIMVLITGVVRGRFAGKRHPWLWRFLHCAAYVSWPIAMVHGLEAGRAAKAWVNWSYIICGAAVAAALLVRLFAMWFKQLSASREAASMTAKTATIKPGAGADSFESLAPPAARTATRRPLATVPDLSPRAAAAGLGLRDDDPLDPARRGLDPRDPDHPARRGYAADEPPSLRAARTASPTYDDPRFAGLRGDDPDPSPGYDDAGYDDPQGYDDRSDQRTGAARGGYDEGYDDRDRYEERDDRRSRHSGSGRYADDDRDADRAEHAYGEDGYTTDPLPPVVPLRPTRRSRHSDPDDPADRPAARSTDRPSGRSSDRSEEQPVARRKKPHTWVPTAPTSPAAPVSPLYPVTPVSPAGPVDPFRPAASANPVSPAPASPAASRSSSRSRGGSSRSLDSFPETVAGSSRSAGDAGEDAREQTKEHRWVPAGTPRGTAQVPPETPTATLRMRPESARDRYRRANGMEPVERTRRGAPEPVRHDTVDLDDRRDSTADLGGRRGAHGADDGRGGRRDGGRREKVERPRRRDDTMTGTARMRPIPRHFPDDDPSDFLDAAAGPRDEVPAWKDPVLSKDLPAPDDLPPAATVAASEMGDEDFWSLIRGGPRT